MALRSTLVPAWAVVRRAHVVQDCDYPMATEQYLLSRFAFSFGSFV